MVTEAVQGCHIAVGYQPDAATMAPVATIRAAFGDMGLTAKRDCAGAAIACFDVNLSFVDEGGHAGSLLSASPGRC
jgi:hypothetical protein